MTKSPARPTVQRRMSIRAGTTLAILLAGGCSNIRVSTDYDPRFDFSGMKTWAWLETQSRPTADPRLDDPLLAKRIRAAVEDTLAERNFTQITAGEPDFGVGYHLAIQRKLDVSAVNDYYGSAPPWAWDDYRYGYGGGFRGRTTMAPTRAVAREYEEGTLILDIVRMPQRELIWRGSATAELDEQSTAERRERRIRDAVRRMLAHFPPGSG